MYPRHSEVNMLFKKKVIRLEPLYICVLQWCHTLPALTDLDEGVDVALGPRELCRFLHVEQHNEVQVVPHVVLQLTVLLKCYLLVVKGGALQTCNVTTVWFKIQKTLLSV